MINQPTTSKASRRKFLTGAAAGAGAATLGLPMVVKSQAPIVIKIQGAWRVAGFRKSGS